MVKSYSGKPMQTALASASVALKILSKGYQSLIISGLNFLLSLYVLTALAIAIDTADIPMETSIPTHDGGSKNLSALFITICIIPKEARLPNIIETSATGIVCRIMSNVRSREFTLNVLSTKSSFPFILQTCPATAKAYSAARRAKIADKKLYHTPIIPAKPRARNTFPFISRARK